MNLSPEEIEAFNGLEESYQEMHTELEKAAPRCHMRPMNFNEDYCEVDGYQTYWECSYCGHTKDA